MSDEGLREGDSMSRRDKFVAKMKQNPGGVRYAELESLLHHEGFLRFNQRGSHCTYHRNDGKVLTVVRPHGGRTTCHPADIKRILEILEL